MYKYEEIKRAIFTEEGVAQLLEMRDHVEAMLDKSGAFTMGRAIDGMRTCGDTWVRMALVDHLVALGELKEITREHEVAGQYRIFVKCGY